MRAMSTEDPHREADPTRTLIDAYLAEQKRLQTPVTRFADAHDSATAIAEPVWRDLIPLTRPSAGEQYAFEVDLDKCTGCKACVAGCHSLNGLDDEETWRDVGLILGGTRAHPFQQTVTTACHHCADPGCLNGCPVLAYEKDPITGIVRHLDDQCIGCQYCVLKCPYDVPKYSERLGIVRKCDMCHNRLSAGEAPACVQACPTQAIRIVKVQTHVNGELAPATEAFLPAAPDPSYTYPTTRYVSKRSLPDNVVAADAETLRPQPPHWPLVLMLTLMPMAVACGVADVMAPSTSPALAIAGWFAGAAGLAASVFHLGQPLRAWRVFLGLRRSWLSREAVIFGAWMPLYTGYVALRWAPAEALQHFAGYTRALGILAATVGLTGLFCSVMIYVDTRRLYWRFSQTLPRFFGSGAVLAAATAFATRPSGAGASILAAAILLKLAVEARTLRPLDSEDEAPTPARHTALLLAGPLRAAAGFRVLTAMLLLLLPAASMAFDAPTAALWLVPLLALASETTERYLFFRAVAAPKMPGVPSL
jgi:formate dehydrogenase iron-sulfur subunit